MKKKLTAALLIIMLVFTGSAYGHSGRTDSNGGHRDNKNVSGLGYYHYHCGGHPPHLHTNGKCPYTVNDSYVPSKSPSKNTSSTAVVNVPKIRLNKPNISTKGYKTYIKVSWKKVNNASKYYVYRSTSKGGTYKKIATTTSTFYKDKTATNEKVYYYKVKAYASGKYTTSYYSNVSSNYRFKGSITIDEDSEIVLASGDKHSFYITAEDSSREVKATSKSEDIKVKLSEPDEDGSYKVTLEVFNNTPDEIEGRVQFYFANRKTNTMQSVTVIVLPSLPQITPGCEYLIMTPGEITWFSLFTENMAYEDVNGLIDSNLFTGMLTETEVEGATADVIIMVNQDVEPGADGILTEISFFCKDDESEILSTVPVLIVAEK